MHVSQMINERLKADSLWQREAAGVTQEGEEGGRSTKCNFPFMEETGRGGCTDSSGTDLDKSQSALFQTH